MAQPQYKPRFYKGPEDNVISMTPGFHKHEPDYRGSHYLQTFVIPGKLRKQIDLSIRALRPHLHKFDAIAFTGMSGALIAPSIAMGLGKEIIMVRKFGQSTHSGHEVEGDFNARSYIIVDDFRSSGATERDIMTKIAKNIPDAEYMGFLSAAYLNEKDVEAAETFNQPIPLLPAKLGDETEYYRGMGEVRYADVVEAAQRANEFDLEKQQKWFSDVDILAGV